MDVPDHTVPYLKKAFDGLQQPLAQFLQSAKPDWIIYDFAPYWLPPINAELGILGICLFTFSAVGSFYILDALGFRASNESAVSDVFRLKSSLYGAHAFALRSCWEIEGENLKNLERILEKPVVSIGLLPPSIQFQDDGENDEWEKIVEWLDKQEKGSVVYIAFGSEATLSKEDFTELAIALELFGLSFFWALKKQNVPSSSDSFELLDRLKQRTNGHGIVRTGWFPQLKILAHKSIGGFLTHCGWNSVTESLQFACPLIMLPMKNEQLSIAKLMEDKRVGIVIPRSEQDGKFTGESVAKLMRSVILQEEGKFYKLHQKYIDQLVDYMKIQRGELASKD